MIALQGARAFLGAEFPGSAVSDPGKYKAKDDDGGNKNRNETETTMCASGCDVLINFNGEEEENPDGKKDEEPAHTSVDALFERVAL